MHVNVLSTLIVQGTGVEGAIFFMYIEIGCRSIVYILQIPALVSFQIMSSITRRFIMELIIQQSG